MSSELSLSFPSRLLEEAGREARPMCCEALQLPVLPQHCSSEPGDAELSSAWAACPRHLLGLFTGQNEGLAHTGTACDLCAQDSSLEASPAPLVQVTACHLTPLESHCSCLGSNASLTSNFLPGSQQQHEMWSAKLRKFILGRVSGWRSGTDRPDPGQGEEGGL